MTCPVADCTWPAMALHAVAYFKKETSTQERLHSVGRTALHHAMGLLLLRASATPHTGMALLQDAAAPNVLHRCCRCCLTDACSRKSNPRLYTSTQLLMPCKNSAQPDSGHCTAGLLAACPAKPAKLVGSSDTCGAGDAGMLSNGPGAASTAAHLHPGAELTGVHRWSSAECSQLEVLAAIGLIATTSGYMQSAILQHSITRKKQCCACLPAGLQGASCHHVPSA